MSQKLSMGMGLLGLWILLFLTSCTNKLTTPPLPNPTPMGSMTPSASLTTSPTATPTWTNTAVVPQSPTATPTFTPTSIATAVSGGTNFNLTSGGTTLTTGAYSYSCFHVGAGAAVTIAGAVTIYTQCFTLDSGATITGVGEGYVNPWLFYSVGLTIPSYILSGGPGSGGWAYNGQASWYLSGGGGHGGAGGTDHDQYCHLANGGTANDDPVHPAFMGSSGDSFTSMASYSNGGALLSIVVYDPAANKVASATVNGTIDMSGYAGCPSCGPNFEGGSGGAGGAIVIEASAILGTGLLQANGGVSGYTAGAGGGGGILSLIENSTTFAGTLSAAGGHGSANGTISCTPPSEDGAAGTVTFTAAPASSY